MLKQEVCGLCTKFRIGLRVSNDLLVTVMRPYVKYRFLTAAVLFIQHKNCHIKY